MPKQPADEIRKLVAGMRPDQQRRVADFAKALASPPASTCRNKGVINQAFVDRIGDALRIHHMFSLEPFTKDKFEYAAVAALREIGVNAVKAPRGNRGHDLTVGKERWSLKTQADAGIRRDFLHISKFMELGRGRWSTESDLLGLRDQMLEHMRSYDRIFSLRRLCSPLTSVIAECEYELVEIPKALLERSAHGIFAMRHESRQNPKPGYCTVCDDKGRQLFQLYFDGGTERKLQIKLLAKSECEVLATWRLTVE